MLTPFAEFVYFYASEYGFSSVFASGVCQIQEIIGKNEKISYEKKIAIKISKNFFIGWLLAKYVKPDRRNVHLSGAVVVMALQIAVWKRFKRAQS